MAHADNTKRSARSAIVAAAIILLGARAPGESARAPGKSAPDGVNLLENGSFEDGADVNGFPAGWSLYGGLGARRRIELAPNDGAGHAVQIVDENTSEEVGLVQRVPAEPGKVYLVSVQVKAVDAVSAHGAYVQLRFLPSDEYVQRPLVPGDSGEFDEVRIGREAPANATHVVVYLYTHRGPTPQVVVDDVTLETVPELPPEFAAPDTAIAPEIPELKPLYLNTDLVADGKAAPIVVPASGAYDLEAQVIAMVIEKESGTRPAIITDDSSEAALPLTSHVIAIGNRSTNRFIATLYERFYTLLDLRYPGPGGLVLRTLHNPFGNGFNAVLVGGSDGAGVSNAAVVFIHRLHEVDARDETLTIGRLMDIELSRDITPQDDIRQFDIWDASAGYGSVGYFGWNSISKRMAMYYMTGDEHHARESLRLAFPDERAKQEIADIDGERIENKDEPLSGPYHYNAHMMILFWDLIEESPVFTDEDRLRVTNAFARQLNHPGIRSAYVGPYTSTPATVGSRHGQWTAIALFALGRYFAKDYDNPVWDVCVENGKLHFAPLHEHAWVSGESDNLYWYNTAIAPIFTYMMLTGDRGPVESGAVATLLRGQEILISGRTPDWALRYASIGFLHKAAYVTGDGRWLTYRNRTGVDLDGFRLGQSYWPEPELSPSLPSDLTRSWQIHALPEPLWRARGSGFCNHDESFQFMSYRSAPDASGDFILLDGFNGASRNPYHTFAILELRQDGRTILEGYLNQLRTRADGLTEPVIPMDAAIRYHNVLGETAVAVGEVPGMAFANWRRSIVHQTGRYTLVVDELSPRIDADNLEVQILWETKQGPWVHDAAAPNKVVLPNAEESAPTPAICASDIELVDTDNGVATFEWIGRVTANRKKRFFSVVAREPVDSSTKLNCYVLSENAAVITLPEPALAVSGSFDEIDGDLVVISATHLYGRDLTHAGNLVRVDAPIEINWNFASGNLTIVSTGPVQVELASSPPGPVRVNEVNKVLEPDAQGLVRLALESGRHRIEGAIPSPKQIGALRGRISTLLSNAALAQGEEVISDETDAAPSVPVVSPTATFSCGEPIADLIVIPSPDGQLLAAAAGSTVHVIASTGEEVRTLSSDGPIRMLRWWDEHRLLLAGCADEKVVAFDEAGQREWEFVSEMDPAVYRAAKTYWFKSAPGHEGIHGLHTGVFLDGKSQVFVGSACTLEILDENGKFLHRMPQFWGKVSLMRIIPGPGDSLNLLAGRKYNGTNALAIVNNQGLDPSPRGFNSVPPGHSYMPGWSSMNRHHIFYDDFDGDGEKDVMTEINGSWNRVTVWAADGTAKYDASFGPGDRIPALNMRDVDTADLDGDGLPEIVVATAKGLIVALEGTCEKIWANRISDSPTVMACVQPAGSKPQVIAGSEKGSLTILDASGEIVATGRVSGKPTCIQNVQDSPDRQAAVLGTDTGEVAVFETSN